nr:MAG TPA: hypothetical protein [Caudoviricetes sp.]
MIPQKNKPVKRFWKTIQKAAPRKVRLSYKI